ncbi:hypothetical protein [Nocardia blacklockiae]|uniref:hypothetical protein n=1 Tax=Nocardia blacklockiae TaxID=480036 RepID=UPI00189543EF|nr:hypothetical protein [Nocardia blacklockiae]MBF6176658.1 hypothetical protein [Nocardia blacklockiae]
MQYRPTAGEMLEALAELLEDVLLPELPEHQWERARVGAAIARTVRREIESNPAAALPERELLAVADSATSEAEHWRALREIVRADLAVATPGYDVWEGT